MGERAWSHFPFRLSRARKGRAPLPGGEGLPCPGLLLALPSPGDATGARSRALGPASGQGRQELRSEGSSAFPRALQRVRTARCLACGGWGQLAGFLLAGSHREGREAPAYLLHQCPDPPGSRTPPAWPVPGAVRSGQRRWLAFYLFLLGTGKENPFFPWQASWCGLSLGSSLGPGLVSEGAWGLPSLGRPPGARGRGAGPDRSAGAGAGDSQLPGLSQCALPGVTVLPGCWPMCLQRRRHVVATPCCSLARPSPSPPPPGLRQVGGGKRSCGGQWPAG